MTTISEVTPTATAVVARLLSFTVSFDPRWCRSSNSLSSSMVNGLVQRTIRTPGIPQSLQQVHLVHLHPLDAFYSPTGHFPGRFTCELNIHGPQSAYTYESVCSQFMTFISAVPDALFRENLTLSNGHIWTRVGCFP